MAYMAAEYIKTQKELAKMQTAFDNLERINNRASTVFIVILFALLAAMMFGLSITDSPKRLISISLAEAGYSVDNLAVEKTDIAGVYKASISAISENGQLIELWTIKPVPGFKTISRAEPYPTQSIRENEKISLRFSSEEYEQLLVLAQQNGESVEDYIKRQVFQGDAA